MTPIKGTANKEGLPLAEQFFAQVSESIQMMFDLTSRIDERVKMLTERQKEIDDHMNRLVAIQQEAVGRLGLLEAKDIAAISSDLKKLSEKIAIMENNDPELKKEVEKLHIISNDIKNNIHSFEIKMELLSTRMGSHDNKITKIIDGIWKTTLMIIAGYILYKLGIAPPPS